MLLFRLTSDTASDSDNPHISYVVLESMVNQNGDNIEESTPVEVLDAEYFDNELIVLVYRDSSGEKVQRIYPFCFANELVDQTQTKIATVRYTDLDYEEFPLDVEIKTRERLAHEVVQRITSGSVCLSDPLYTLHTNLMFPRYHWDHCL